MKRTILLLALALVVVSTNATVRYVKIGGTTAANAAGATSWGTACADLQAVITTSSAGDQIWVAAGTYKPNSIVSTNGSANPTGTTSHDHAFVLKEGVKIYGGFSATGTPAFTDRNWVTYKTTLGVDIGTYRYHVVIGAGTSANPITDATVLDGFTVTGGSAIGSNYISVNGQNINPGGGGGIYNSHSSPTLTNLTVSGNQTFNNGYGGGIYNYYSSPTLTNVTISGNRADNYGGGIYNTYSSPKLTNVTISGNKADYYGGGIYNTNSSSPIIYNSILCDNQAAIGANVHNTNLSGTPTYEYSLVQGSGGSSSSATGTTFGTNISETISTQTRCLCRPLRQACPPVATTA